MNFRRALRKLRLAAATCPQCGKGPTYVGANTIECPTEGCKNYSEKQAKDVGSRIGAVKRVELVFPGPLGRTLRGKMHSHASARMPDDIRSHFMYVESDDGKHHAVNFHSDNSTPLLPKPGLRWEVHTATNAENAKKYLDGMSRYNKDDWQVHAS
jgi:hypothetical protein